MIKVFFNIFVSLLVFSCNSYSDGKYISKFVTQESERDHGGLDEVYLLGSYVVWQGEDSSGDNQVYLLKVQEIKLKLQNLMEVHLAVRISLMQLIII